jgi:hypothetical protein
VLQLIAINRIIFNFVNQILLHLLIRVLRAYQKLKDLVFIFEALAFLEVTYGVDQLFTLHFGLFVVLIHADFQQKTVHLANSLNRFDILEDQLLMVIIFCFSIWLRCWWPLFWSEQIVQGGVRITSLLVYILCAHNRLLHVCVDSHTKC